ncbi:hypothetical protein [Altericroceibacterium spongiae]|nr:hypothetical protein [Altericroceibacterium spongiae]
MTRLPLFPSAAATVLMLTACTATGPASAPAGPSDHPGTAYARIGETVYVDGPQVTPLEVLEDSRCPKDVQCIQAGQVRLKVRIDLGSGSEFREFAWPERNGAHRRQVADGTLELVSVTPVRVSSQPPAPQDYRFGFTFAGGI